MSYETIVSIAERRAVRKAMKRQRAFGVILLILAVLIMAVSSDVTIPLLFIVGGLWLILSRKLNIYVEQRDIDNEIQALQEKYGEGSV